MPNRMSNTDSTLRSVCASMEMEGFCVSKQTQEDCRAVLRGEKSWRSMWLRLARSNDV